MARKNVLERRITRFLRTPPSVRTAAGVIVTATLLVVVIAGVVIRLIDEKEYSSVWVGMWWALQTVTTVGYGDVTPVDTAGRIVGAVVMLEGIAFLAIITAAITSSFVARATREYEEHAASEAGSEQRHIDARLDELERKLDLIQAALGDSRGV